MNYTRRFTALAVCCLVTLASTSTTLAQNGVALAERAPLATNDLWQSGQFDAHAIVTAGDPSAPELNDEGRSSPQRRGRGGAPRGVYKSRISPNWIADDEQFWYRNDLANEAKEFILVIPSEGQRRPAFDHTRLAEALSAASETTYEADRLPFAEIDFTADGQLIQFTADGARWACHLDSYECWQMEDDGAPEEDGAARNAPPQSRRFGQRSGRDAGSRSRSPDGKWRAVIRDDNVFLVAIDGDEEVQLSDDGEDGNSYGSLQWAPDSKSLVAFRRQPGDDKEVFLVESSPRGGGRALLHRRSYALPGDKLASFEVNVFDIESRKQIKPDVDTIELGWGRPNVVWRDGGERFAYRHVDRGHQRFRVTSVDTRTGDAKNLIDEQTETFIWTAHTENLDLDLVNWLEHSEEIVYVSEQDGWRHLYLIDSKEGGTKNQITSGQYVVRGIDRIDEANRQIWFQASGKNEGQDPYFIHYYRVNFDGSDLTALTEGDGNHSIQFSPDRKYLIDTYSRADAPPVHKLRSAADGSLVCELEEADASELEETGWQPPEVFVAKGRDGETDIWGLIHRPEEIEDGKSYPIIESIYAGPQGSFVPKSFSGRSRFTSLTDMGFIVVQIDGMGTANRSKAFHDVCWHNLKDGGFPDRILWIQAASKEYPYMDLERVGVYGGSAGGQNAAAAVLFHPEFYKAAVAGCGCHDNRMDKASWNEQWMGYPVGPQYAECSNIDNAHLLQGKLMLILGEMDTNVPTESTTRLVDALIKADKDFDFVLVPGAGHGMGGAYGNRRLHDFFVRHLLHQEPPDRNAE